MALDLPHNPALKVAQKAQSPQIRSQVQDRLTSPGMANSSPKMVLERPVTAPFSRPVTIPKYKSSVNPRSQTNQTLLEKMRNIPSFL